MSTHDPVRFVAKNMRLDLALIAGMIKPGSRVLDIGCGDGTLIERLYSRFTLVTLLPALLRAPAIVCNFRHPYRSDRFSDRFTLRRQHFNLP